MLCNRYAASLTNRSDILANTISLYIDDENGKEDVKDIYDIFVSYSDVALLSNDNKFNQNEIDDFHVPGLYSLIHYLENNYKNIEEKNVLKNIKYYLNEEEYILNTNKTTTNINKNIKSAILNQQYFTNQTKKNYNTYNVNQTIKKVPNYINIENYSNQTKKQYNNVNKTMKKVPNYINIENNFYYIKKTINQN